MIPLSNPRANYRAHEVEIKRAIRDVLDRGRYVGGDQVRKFEKEFAAFIGTKHAIGVNSGTDALIVAMMALSMGPNGSIPSDISVRADTALATVAAIIRVGALPILVRPEDNAGIAVHLHGNAIPPTLALIEDCAQACGGTFEGKRLGTFGLIGCFSFYPTKNLSAIGDGGMIVTNDDRVAKKCRWIREYGWNAKRVPQCLGFNSRLDSIQAAVLRVKLKYLDKENERRKQIASRYNDALRDLVNVPNPRNHCFHLYVIECDRRDELAAYLKRNDILTGIHYATPIHKEPVYKDKVKIGTDLREVEKRARRILSLPMYSELTDAEVDKVSDTVRGFYS